MPPADPGRPLRADARANRDALLRIATERYLEHGPEVTFEEIAHDAGVGRATAYRHFPTRDALLVAMLERLVARFEALAAAAGDGPEAFARLFDEALRAQAEHLPLIELLPAAAERSDELAGQLAPLRERVNVAFRAPLVAAQQRGGVRADLTVDEVRVLASMVSAVLRPQVSDEDRARAQRLAQLVIEPESRRG